MTGHNANSRLDEKARAKAVSLYRDHGIGIREIAERYSCSFGTIQNVMADAGLLKSRETSGAQIDRAYDLVLAAAIAGQRCPMNDCLPGGSKSLSLLARDGKILVEIFVHNFRRATILTGEHRGKTTANPPKYAGKDPSPYLTIGLVKRRNGAIIPSVLDARPT